MWLFLERTPYGALIKAGAHDSEMVRALGVNLPRLRLLVFAFGSGLAAVAGVIMAPIWGVRPHVGIDAVVPAFIVIVLGGVGSFWGAVLGGLLIGELQSITTVVYAPAANVVIYLCMALVLILKPSGLTGGP